MVRDGDEEAATILYDRYAKRMFGLVRSNLGEKLKSATEPEDIVQSVFRSVFRGMLSGHYEAPPGETLWNLMAVIAMNKLRHKATHHNAQRRDIDRRISIDKADEMQPLATDDSSMTFFETCVREILETLRPLDREILTLRIQGNSVKDIAEQVDRSCRSVERSLQNSRETLATLLLDE
jgi:RNA polymerase sigma-70 factor (ECF subfamily)